MQPAAGKRRESVSLFTLSARPLYAGVGRGVRLTAQHPGNGRLEAHRGPAACNRAETRPPAPEFSRGPLDGRFWPVFENIETTAGKQSEQRHISHRRPGGYSYTTPARHPLRHPAARAFQGVVCVFWSMPQKRPFRSPQRAGSLQEYTCTALHPKTQQRGRSASILACFGLQSKITGGEQNARPCYLPLPPVTPCYLQAVNESFTPCQCSGQALSLSAIVRGKSGHKRTIVCATIHCETF